MHKPEMENKRIQYSRDFLLSIQFMPDCMQKPEGLPPIPDVVLHKELFRTVRGFLNKLTPEMFNQLMKQIKELHIDTEERLKGVVDLIFEKAIDEANFSVGYGIMCKSLAALNVPMAKKPKSNVNFRMLLLNQCQKEFEKDKT
ncbi:eukaryotic translation initiation factor 4 gamma 3 isoform X7, partial [Silurus asotus]